MLYTVKLLQLKFKKYCWPFVFQIIVNGILKGILRDSGMEFRDHVIALEMKTVL
jgi:hypothetical protein